MSVFDTAIQALRAVSTDTQVRANNVANLNTDAFKAARVLLESGPRGRGVRVASVDRTTAPGPAVSAPDGLREGSNTDVVREMVGLMTDEHAFAANAAVIRTGDRLLGSVLDTVA
ncbi:MAG: flagellar basal body rod protein [Desulfovibrionaceae bacterium]|jgi:flagellar basal-body rod protein FlgC|nr:flagellar basal body rod protein [Desulfovibrionaceae bacterium]